MHHYVLKTLADLGGIRIDYNTREPVPEELPDFVERPWLEHDEATRAAIQHEETRVLRGEEGDSPEVAE